MIEPARQSQPLRRPLIGLTLAFMAGAWAAVMIGGLPAAWLGAASACLLILSLLAHGGIRLFQRHRPVVSVFSPAWPVLPRLISGGSTLCLYLAVVTLAWFAASVRLEDPSPRVLSVLMEKPRESVELEGIIADDPIIRPSWRGDRDIGNFPLWLDEIRRRIPWQPARGTVQVILKISPEGRPPQYGDRWRLAGVLTDNARFPEEEFAANSSRPVLEWVHQRYTFYADPSAAVFLGAHQGHPVLEACFQFRRKCADILALGIGHRPEVVGLLQALLLGYRQELPEKLRNDFTVTGTYHIFAISGQHVAILSLFLIVLLQAYRISRVKWFLLLAPVLAIFTVSTGMSSSAVRGCLMALLCFLGPWIGRKPDIPSAMALAALVILAVDPFQMFHYGFLLSFVAVTGLIVLCPPMLRRVTPEMEPDPLRLQPESASVRWGRCAVRAVVFLFVTSLAAWLVTAPLVARWFNLVSPVALLANLVVIPVTTLVLLAGCLAIVFGWAIPILGEIFNFANVALVSLLLDITGLMARIPYGHVFVRSPPLWSLGLWYMTLAVWVVWRQRVWIWIVGPVLLTVAMSAGCLEFRHGVTVDVLNEEEGPICFVKGPGGEGLLIDPGSRYESRKVIRHLRRQGVNRLKAVVVTGTASARAGGALDILRALPVSELWIPSGAGRSELLREANKAARRNGSEIHFVTNGATIPLRGATTWTVPGSSAEGLPAPDAESGFAWLLRRGTVSVLYTDNLSSPIAALDNAPDSRLSPTVVIENRMNQNLGRNARAAWPETLPAGWHLICTRSLHPEAQTQTPASSRGFRLAPGQGMRIYMERHGVRLKPLTF